VEEDAMMRLVRKAQTLFWLALPVLGLLASAAGKFEQT
jgi:hypothetical protein